MMYKKTPKLLNQFQYSEREGVPLIVIVGEDEKARGGVKIRDTLTREEVCGSEPPVQWFQFQSAPPVCACRSLSS